MGKNSLLTLLDSLYESEIEKELKLIKILKKQEKWTSLAKLEAISGYTKSTITNI